MSVNEADGIAIVTGAGGGFGRETVTALLEAGYKVSGLDVSAAALEELSRTWRPEADRLTTEQVDMSDVHGVQASIRDIEQKYGRIDVLVNCAGIASGTPIAHMTEEEWDNTYATNVRGLFFACQAVCPGMISRQSGRIINISSLVSFTGGILSSAAYSSSKAAVTCTTKNFAKYLAPYQVTVNEVAPGTARTAMSERFIGDRLAEFEQQIPLGRLCRAGDVAAAVLYLASAGGSYVTGQTIHVNGGSFM